MPVRKGDQHALRAGPADPFVDAFRAEGRRVGFYYSLIDWRHTDLPIDVIHPLRNHPDALEMNKSRDVTKYAEYMRNQLTASDIIINNRLDLPKEYADIYTSQQFQPREWVKVDGEPVVWEACQTFSGSWGYHRDEEEVMRDA